MSAELRIMYCASGRSGRAEFRAGPGWQKQPGLRQKGLGNAPA